MFTKIDGSCLRDRSGSCDRSFFIECDRPGGSLFLTWAIALVNEMEWRVHTTVVDWVYWTIVTLEFVATYFVETYMVQWESHQHPLKIYDNKPRYRIKINTTTHEPKATFAATKVSMWQLVPTQSDRKQHHKNQYRNLLPSCGVQGDRAIAPLMQQNESRINHISLNSDALSRDRAPLSARLGTGSPARSAKKGFFYLL